MSDYFNPDDLKRSRRNWLRGWGVLIATTVFTVFLFGLSIKTSFAATCAAHSGARTDFYYIGGSTFTRDTAVKFTTAAECDISTIEGNFAKDAGSADTLQLSIYDNNAGVPGVPLTASSTVSGTITNYSTFNNYAAPVSYCLPAGTYWIVASRTGSPSDANVFEWGSAGTAAGAGASRVTGAWSTNTYQFIYAVNDGGTACGGGSGGDTASSTSETVDDPAGTLFNAMILFMLSMSFVVWLMRK